MKLLKADQNKHWRSYEYCSIDIETTGLNFQKDEVISIGAVSIIDGRFPSVGNFYEEISPVIKPSVSSIQVHGLRGVDLESALPVDQVIPAFISKISTNYLITHAGWVERAFLTAPLRGQGYKFPKHIIDTAALARFCGYADETSGHEPSLEFLARKLNLPVYAPHHALGDAMTTAVVFLALAGEIERTGELLTVKRLLELSQ
ncbi:MAG: 3'-5' exonuclease [Actinomycetes bacterium]